MGISTFSQQTVNTGLANPAGSGNVIINGAFDIWQRGTSGLTIGNSLSNAFSADRWSSFRPANHTAISVTRGTASGVPNSPNFIRLQRVASNTSTEKVTFGQTIEIANASVFAGQAVTLSYYARRGANYSSSSNLISSQLKTGTGATDLNGIYNGYTGQVSNAVSDSLSLEFERFTRTIPIPANATQIAIAWEFTPTGTAGANDYVDITGVQLEAGTVATPFRRNAPSVGAELAACQRYFQLIDYASATATASNLVRARFIFPTRMRVAPTIGQTGILNLQGGGSNNATQSAVGIGSVGVTDIGAVLYGVPNFTGLATSQFDSLAVPPNNANRITLSAEL
jgi:hypothetical protein